MEPLKSSIATMRTLTRNSKPHGFTLIELITVIAVMAVLFGLVAPSVSDTIQASTLTTVGDNILNEIVAAQQIAVSENRVIDVRFLRFTDPDSTLATTAIVRALLVTGTEDNPAGSAGATIVKVIRPPIRFPSPIVAADGAGISTLTDAAEPNIGTGTSTSGSDVDPSADPPNLFSESSYSYTYLRFYPDGSTGLPIKSGTAPLTDTWHLTLVNEVDTVVTGGALPSNFYTIVLDAVTGRATRFRP